MVGKRVTTVHGLIRLASLTRPNYVLSWLPQAALCTTLFSKRGIGVQATNKSTVVEGNGKKAGCVA